ncbi:MAG: flagellar motor protein MotB [Blastopirellula sp.]|nr:MAG: flagellar motor protein MotB [Blastopirellula sp.]
MVSLKHLIATAFIAAAGSVTPGVVMAQSSGTMTAEEMTAAFKKQKTRGLVIVPSGQESSTDNATETTSVAATTTAPEDSAAYAAVDRADQVNIQVSFDFDSAALRDDQKAKLVTLCQVMQAVDVAMFQIIGHTDSSGKAAYNQRLSLLRAQEVKRHLVSSCGIDEVRLKAVGMGESVPLDTQNTRSDENRRVEFQALG